MIVKAADRTALSVRTTPSGAEHEGPPIREIAKVNWMIRRTEDQRARPQHARQHTRIVFRVRGNLGDGDVTGRFNKLPELAICDGGRVDPESVDRDAMGGRFFGIVPVRSHPISAAGNEHHWRGRDSGIPNIYESLVLNIH